MDAAFVEFEGLFSADISGKFYRRSNKSFSGRERILAESSFSQLTPDQKGIFFAFFARYYLQIVDTIPDNHILSGLTRLQWIKIILQLAAQIKGKFGPGECWGDANINYYPEVEFLNKDGLVDYSEF